MNKRIKNAKEELDDINLELRDLLNNGITSSKFSLTKEEQDKKERLEIKQKIAKINLREAQKEEIIENTTIRSGDTLYVDENAVVRTDKVTEWLMESANKMNKGKFYFEFRADPILTTTDTAVLNRTVQSPDILMSPSAELLKNLGVQFLNKNFGGTGKIELPVISEISASFVAENADLASASLSTNTQEVGYRRIGFVQSVTREWINQTDPKLLNEFINTMYGGIWNGIADAVFDLLDASAATQICGNGNSVVNFGHLVNLEASVGYSLRKPAYVMLPQTKAYLKKTTKLANTQNTIWENDKVNELPAYSTKSANDERIYYGDFSKVMVAFVSQNGDQNISLLVDPYSDAKKGEVKLIMEAYVALGLLNKNAFSILGDASTF